ncbi:hypothetical protein OIU78_009087 [Salix suchowensis]|nr:hypothetical protein OIU78_009087 [Salix suchowensis]
MPLPDPAHLPPAPSPFLPIKPQSHHIITQHPTYTNTATF